MSLEWVPFRGLDKPKTQFSLKSERASSKSSLNSNSQPRARVPRLPSKNTCQSFCQNFSFCASKVGMEKQTELGISRSSSRRCCCCHRRRCRNANTCAPLAKSATRPVWPDGQIAFSKFGHFYNNETLPNCMTKNWPKYDQYFSKILNKPSNVCQRLRFLPKWRMFAKSGHTGRDKRRRRMKF